jgi:hypothetical protein
MIGSPLVRMPPGRGLDATRHEAKLRARRGERGVVEKMGGARSREGNRLCRESAGRERSVTRSREVLRRVRKSRLVDVAGLTTESDR